MSGEQTWKKRAGAQLWFFHIFNFGFWKWHKGGWEHFWVKYGYKNGYKNILKFTLISKVKKKFWKSAKDMNSKQQFFFGLKSQKPQDLRPVYNHLCWFYTNIVKDMGKFVGFYQHFLAFSKKNTWTTICKKNNIKNV